MGETKLVARSRELERRGLSKKGVTKIRAESWIWGGGELDWKIVFKQPFVLMSTFTQHFYSFCKGMFFCLLGIWGSSPWDKTGNREINDSTPLVLERIWKKNLMYWSVLSILMDIIWKDLETILKVWLRCSWNQLHSGEEGRRNGFGWSNIWRSLCFIMTLYFFFFLSELYILFNWILVLNFG